MSRKEEDEEKKQYKEKNKGKDKYKDWERDKDEEKDEGEEVELYSQNKHCMAESRGEERGEELICSRFLSCELQERR